MRKMCATCLLHSRRFLPLHIYLGDSPRTRVNFFRDLERSRQNCLAGGQFRAWHRARYVSNLLDTWTSNGVKFLEYAIEAFDGAATLARCPVEIGSVAVCETH